MRDINPKSHFHGVTICRQCRLIEVPAVFKNYEQVKDFFTNLQNGLEDSRIRHGSTIKVDCQILIPNEVARLTTGGSHEDGHDVIFVVHECPDDFDYCMKSFLLNTARAFASKIMSDLAITDMETKENSSKKKDASQKLLESLDLPDDLFHGMN